MLLSKNWLKTLNSFTLQLHVSPHTSSTNSYATHYITWTVNAQVLKHISHNLRADSITTYNIFPEISTTSNTHAARENLPRMVVLRNLFAIIIVFSHSTALPFLGKISEGNQARYILECCMGILGLR